MAIDPSTGIHAFPFQCNPQAEGTCSEQYLQHFVQPVIHAEELAVHAIRSTVANAIDFANAIRWAASDESVAELPVMHGPIVRGMEMLGSEASLWQKATPLAQELCNLALLAAVVGGLRVNIEGLASLGEAMFKRAGKAGVESEASALSARAVETGPVKLGGAAPTRPLEPIQLNFATPKKPPLTVPDAQRALEQAERELAAINRARRANPEPPLVTQESSKEIGSASGKVSAAQRALKKAREAAGESE